MHQALPPHVRPLHKHPVARKSRLLPQEADTRAPGGQQLHLSMRIQAARQAFRGLRLCRCQPFCARGPAWWQGYSGGLARGRAPPAAAEFGRWIRVGGCGMSLLLARPPPEELPMIETKEVGVLSTHQADAVFRTHLPLHRCTSNC